MVLNYDATLSKINHRRLELKLCCKLHTSTDADPTIVLTVYYYVGLPSLDVSATIGSNGNGLDVVTLAS